MVEGSGVRAIFIPLYFTYSYIVKNTMDVMNRKAAPERTCLCTRVSVQVEEKGRGQRLLEGMHSLQKNTASQGQNRLQRKTKPIVGQVSTFPPRLLRFSCGRHHLQHSFPAGNAQILPDTHPWQFFLNTQLQIVTLESERRASSRSIFPGDDAQPVGVASPRRRLSLKSSGDS